MSEQYQDQFREKSFWSKIANSAGKIGKDLLWQVFRLYYAFQSPDTPVWAKTTIMAALGYFIFPLDAIPDLIPVVGYTDDAAALTAAIATVSTYITPEVDQKAEEQIKNIFG